MDLAPKGAAGGIGKYPKTFLLLILAWLFALSSEAGDIYYWIDRNGTKHFTNSPPPDGSRFLKKIREKPPSRFTPDPPSISPDAVSKYGEYSVTKVYDGDSFKAIGQTVTIHVRLAGIDAPEMARENRPGQPFSQRAKAFLEELILNRAVSVRGFGTGAYNRQLAEVFIDGKNVGLELVRAGLADLYPGAPPREFDSSAYTKALAAAKSAKIGIWSLGIAYQSPSSWRKQNR